MTIIRRILNFLSGQSKDETSENQINSPTDYLKSNTIDKRMILEVLKSDKLRIQILSNLIEIQNSKLHEKSGVNMEGNKMRQDIKLALKENKQLFEKLEKRAKEHSDTDIKPHQKKEELDRLEKLRSYIENEKFDHFFEQLLKERKSEFYNSLILLSGRYHSLENDMRQKLISEPDYYFFKFPVMLEMVNFIDQSCYNSIVAEVQ